MRVPRNRATTHPGEILLHEYLIPMSVSQKELAARLGVSYPRVNELVHGKRGVTPDTALRLSRLLGTTPEFWLNLQMAWDLHHARTDPRAKDIEDIDPIETA